MKNLEKNNEFLFGISGYVQNMLTLAQRDPVDDHDAHTNYWLNKKTNKLFQYSESKWMLLQELPKE